MLIARYEDLGNENWESLDGSRGEERNVQDSPEVESETIDILTDAYERAQRSDPAIFVAGLAPPTMDMKQSAEIVEECPIPLDRWFRLCPLGAPDLVLSTAIPPKSNDKILGKHFHHHGTALSLSHKPSSYSLFRAMDFDGQYFRLECRKTPGLTVSLQQTSGKRGAEPIMWYDKDDNSLFSCVDKNGQFFRITPKHAPKFCLSVNELSNTADTLHLWDKVGNNSLWFISDTRKIVGYLHSPYVYNYGPGQIGLFQEHKLQEKIKKLQNQVKRNETETKRMQLDFETEMKSKTNKVEEITESFEAYEQEKTFRKAEIEYLQANKKRFVDTASEELERLRGIIRELSTPKKASIGLGESLFSAFGWKGK